MSFCAVTLPRGHSPAAVHDAAWCISAFSTRLECNVGKIGRAFLAICADRFDLLWKWLFLLLVRFMSRVAAAVLRCLLCRGEDIPSDVVKRTKREPDCHGHERAPHHVDPKRERQK